MNHIDEVYNKKASFYSKHINRYIVKYVTPNKTILDVGCADGTLGEYLIKHYKAKVYGIDISSEAIASAKNKLDKAVVCNIEKEKLPFKKKFFGIIICGDVLEHLFDPVGTLTKLREYLKDDGYMILCVPNIANIAVRWNLLWGKFDYQEGGILDNRHLKFYTKKTLLKLIFDSGMVLKKIEYPSGFSFFFLKEKKIQNSPTLQKLKELLNKPISSSTLICSGFITVIKKI